MNKIKIFLVLLIISGGITFAQEQNEEASGNLADQIQNPIASLISLPFQNNMDFGVGPFERTRNTLNIQPVIPFQLSENTNLISRTIIPIISQPTGPDDNEFGLGDINLSMFLTPAKPGKVIYGYGVSLGLPTATDPILGSEKWSAGPSVIALIQPDGWTIGALAQNTWSFAGADDRGDVNFFYSQVFITKNLEKGWYVNSAPIITSNWEAASGQQWTLPVGAGFGKLFSWGKQPINAQAGYYFNAVRPDGAAESQFRLQVIFLFPQ